MGLRSPNHDPIAPGARDRARRRALACMFLALCALGGSAVYVEHALQRAAVAAALHDVLRVYGDAARDFARLAAGEGDVLATGRALGRLAASRDQLHRLRNAQPALLAAAAAAPRSMVMRLVQVEDATDLLVASGARAVGAQGVKRTLLSALGLAAPASAALAEAERQRAGALLMLWAALAALGGVPVSMLLRAGPDAAPAVARDRRRVAVAAWPPSSGSSSAWPRSRGARAARLRLPTRVVASSG